MAPIDPSRLHRPVGEWPLLLVGPMVRRVTKTSVAVFLAASEPFTVTLKIFDDPGPTGEPLSGGAEGVAPSLALGRSLHVCVVEKTGLALAPGNVYGYDIELDTAGGSRSLGSMGLLEPPLLLGYETGHLPGFVLPRELDRLRVAHCSCRKSHGCDPGVRLDPDALPLVDRLIEENRTDPSARLQQLFLTGDQVYSDDVPAALLAALTSAGRELLAWGRPEQATPERFPLRGGGEGLLDTDQDQLAPGKRSTFLDSQGIKDRPADAKDWKEYAANHLLFYSEWCAMYVFAWSDALWLPLTGPPGDNLNYTLPPADEVWADSPPTTGPALIYAQTSPLVRRALANVATYMSFDDHDVTDDWFLNGVVAAQQRGGPGGRRLMRNALAAYAVFQHWGNQPDAFAAGKPGGRLLDLLDVGTAGTPTIGLEGQEAAADTILDVGLEPVGPTRRDERMRWDYELVCDGHRVIVLDTRTWRSFPPEPVPISEDALREAADQRGQVTGDWGPDALDALAEPWRNAADAVAVASHEPEATMLGAFLDHGAELLSDCATLAREAEAGGAAWEPAANGVQEHATGLIEAVLAAPGIQPFDWTTASLGAAMDALSDSDHGSAATVDEGVFALGTAMLEAHFRVSSGLNDWLRSVGLASLSEQEDSFRVVIQSLDDLLFVVPAFLEGAAVSVTRAAGDGPDLAQAWIALAADAPPALWGSLGSEIDEALEAALSGSEVAEPLFDDAAVRYAGVVDPVFSLLNGEAASRLNAALISREALAFQVEERVAGALADPRELTLVVSPAPVFGHWLVELLQRGSIIKDEANGVAGDETWDNEPWSSNIPSWSGFLDALAPLESVVFLSGDVHYAFTSVNDYRGVGGHRARFIQLTASPAKNADDQTRLLARFALPAEVAGGVASQALHYLHILPPRQDLLDFPEDLRSLLPSREDVLEGLAECADTLAEQDGGGFAPLAIPDLEPAEWSEVLAGDTGDEWERVRSAGAYTTEESARGAVAVASDPTRVVVGDRLFGSAILEEQVLLLYDSLGLDVGQTVDLTSYMLSDMRGEDRFSPGLRTRIIPALPKKSRVALTWSGRMVVGRNNVGVISTAPTKAGRVVVHDLHWFPDDSPTSLFNPLTGGSFRNDWIVTRHAAGLGRRQPPDAGLLGAP